MASTTFMNGSIETPVTTSKPLPAQMIDGYTSASISVVNVNGGATPVALGAAACRAVDLFNNTGVDLEYRRNGTGSYFPVPNGTARLITAVTDASQISFRRIDQSATTVSLAFEILS